MFNLIIFGPPGCGKGTQSKLVAKEFSFLHLSTGDILRKEIEQKTGIGILVKKFIDRGLLVPDNIVLRELYRFAVEHKNAPGIVFDGFPRTLIQAEALDKVFHKKSLKIQLVISMQVNKEELTKRILARAGDSHRSDDTRDVLERRFEIYQEQTLPVIKYYKKTGNRLIDVNGLLPVEVVSTHISQIIHEHFH